MPDKTIRYDKFVWAARLYKTRSMATDACKNGRITVNGVSVKPSRLANSGEVFNLRKNGITYTYRIKQLLHNRVGAKLVDDYLEDITRPEELEKLELDQLAQNVKRQRGTGRPTKKERRDLDDLISP